MHPADSVIDLSKLAHEASERAERERNGIKVMAELRGSVAEYIPDPDGLGIDRIKMYVPNSKGAGVIDFAAIVPACNTVYFPGSANDLAGVTAGMPCRVIIGVQFLRDWEPPAEEEPEEALVAST